MGWSQDLRLGSYFVQVTLTKFYTFWMALALQAYKNGIPLLLEYFYLNILKVL